MRHHQQPPDDSAHDVLAAEEFAVGAADPELHSLHALHDVHDVHDVLAAEEFAVGAADPALHHGPVVLPPDPYGESEPHDVLAAEEFALPAAPPGSRVPLGAGARPPRPLLLGAAGLVGVLALRARRGAGDR